MGLRTRGRRLALGLAAKVLLFCAFGWGAPAAGYDLQAQRSVWLSDETVEIQFDSAGLRSAEIEILRARELYENVSYSGRPWWRLARDEAGTLRFFAWRILGTGGWASRESDPHRQQALVVLRGETDDSSRRRVELRFWVTIIQRSTEKPGALQRGGPERIALGERLAPQVPDLAGLRAATRHPEYGSSALSLVLVQLGRRQPGGAVLPDRVLGELLLGEELPGPLMVRSEAEVWALKDAGVRDLDRTTLAYPGLGHYELRLLGPGQAVLDRAAFTVILPERAATLRLEPPREGAYDYRDAPLVYLDLDPAAPFAWPGWLEGLSLVAARVESGRLLAASGAAGRYLADDVAAGRPPLDLHYVSGGLRPGAHLVTLLGLASDPDRNRLARLAETVFEIGGDYPPDWLPKRQEPPLDFGAVAMTLQPGALVPVGESMTLALAAPPGIDLAERRAWVEVHFAPRVHGFDCGLFETAEDRDLYQIGRLPVGPEGRVSFLAPGVPERFEIQLLEPDAWGQSVLLATLPFATTLADQPGALSLARGALVGQPIELLVTLPPGLYYDQFALELWRSAEIAPGGAMTPARWIDLRGFEGSSGSVSLPPVFVPGLYEARLMIHGSSRPDPFYYGERGGLDRLQFLVAAPDAPPLPDWAAFRPAPALDAWPSAEDPRRAASVWYKTPADCAPPPLPPAARLQVVEWQRGETPEEDRYLPVAALFPGHPYLLQATFDSAPEWDSYRASLPAGLILEVTRTADPRLYRSGFFTLKPDEAAP